MSRSDFDVIIVGAGMVGGALAAALRDSPLSVMLLDAGPVPAPPEGRYDLRVSAVSPGTRAILEEVGAWQQLAADRIGPYSAMRVWDAGSGGSIGFDAAELGEPWLGYIVENGNIHSALHAAVKGAGNVERRFDSPARGIDIDDTRCRLMLDGGEVLSGRLVVGADGSHSWVRKQLGIDLDMRLYGQRAFVCEVRTQKPHDRTAWQRFLPTGPIAFLPLANGHCSVVWTCDAELAAGLAEVDQETFGDQLQTAFESRLGEVEIVGPVKSFDLSRRQAACYVVERGALIGDAAHVVHPLAGQGANLGFADAWSLARVLLDARRRERDIGRRHVLRRFERWRRSENFSMMRTLDALHALFSTDSRVLSGFRGLGLNMVDRQRWLKHLMANQAIGRPSRQTL